MNGTMVATARPANPAIVPHPAAPRTLEDSGLSFDLLMQLVTKTLHFAGESSGAALSRTLGVPHSVIEPVLRHLKMQPRHPAHGMQAWPGQPTHLQVAQFGGNLGHAFRRSNVLPHIVGAIVRDVKRLRGSHNPGFPQ